MPVDAGFSLGDYYEDAAGHDDTFGYWDLGAFVSCPLSMVPARYGEWSLSVGSQLFFLNGNQKELNHDQGTEWAASATLSIGF